MLNLIAPGSKNVLREARLRMCEMRFKPPPPHPAKRKEGEPSLTEQLLAGLTARVLEQAYVILVPLGDPDAARRPEGGSAIAARTTEKGELVRIEETEFDGGVPADPGRVVLLEPGWHYACFWARRSDLFKKVWSQVKADPASAIREHPFNVFRVAFHVASGVSEKFPTYKMDVRYKYRAEQLLNDSMGLYLGKPVHGMYRGWDVLWWGPEGKVDENATYVFARSDAVAALYVVEMINRQAIDRQWEGSTSFEAFQVARAFVDAALAKQRSSELDKRLPPLQEDGVGGGPFLGQNAAWNNEYYEYAYSCAKAGVERKLFNRSVNITALHPEQADEAGYEIARTHPEAGKKYPRAIPDKSGQYRFKRTDPEAVQAYFDFYRFGFEERRKQWYRDEYDLQRSEPYSQRDIKQKIESLRYRLGEFMQKRAPYGRFMQELDAHGEANRDDRLQMHRRYWNMALATRYCFWEDFPIDSEAETEKDRKWKPFAPYVDWIAEGTNKVGELFGKILGEPNELLELNQALRENVGAFERFFQKMDDFDRRVGRAQKPVERLVKKGTTIEADFQKRVFMVKLSGKEPHELGPVHFFVDVKRSSKQIVLMGQGKRKRIRRATITTETGRAFVLDEDIPFKSIHTWPAWLAAAGETMALAIALWNLSDELKGEDKVQVFGKLATSGCQAVGTMSEAIAITLTARKRVPGLFEAPASLKMIGTAGNALEAIFNVREGLILLFDKDESEMFEELDEGHDVEAKLLFVKGFTLVGSVAPAGATFVTALASGAGPVEAAGLSSTPLGWGMIAAGMVAVGVESYLAWRKGPRDVMEDVRERLEKAVKEEFGTRYDQYNVSRTADELGELVTATDKVLTVLES